MKRRLLKTLAAVLAIAAAAAGPVRGQNSTLWPSTAVVYDFEAAAAAEENPANKNGSTANGQAFYGWERSDRADSKRQDYKGYFWSDGSVLPEVCHVWRRSDRINGNVSTADGGLKCPNNREMAIDSLTAGMMVVIIYDSTAVTAESKQILWAIGDGTAPGGPGHPRATATIGGVEAVTGVTPIRSGDTIIVTSVTPAENGTGYIVFQVKANMVIKQIAVWEPSAPAVPHTVRFASGNDGWTVTDVDSARSATAPAVLQNVMAGDSLVVTAPATLPGKVKSVKAVKYVVPPTPLDNTTTAWSAGTFVVPAGGLTYSNAITVSGDVTLVLTDGTTLTLNKGISLASGATLTIQGNGTMNVNGTNESTASTVAGSGTLVLTSGTLTARGGNGGSVGDLAHDSHGGNGGNAINGSVIVSGGTLTARGGNGGSVGELGNNCSGGKGGDAISGTLTINGGSTSVNNGSNGSIGEDSDHCTAGAGGKAVAGTVTDNR